MREDRDQDPLKIERSGSSAGLNPMFGEWQHTFAFAPVPYGDGGAKRTVFREAIQSQFTNKWIYSHEIHLEITLHLDVQTVLETSETADLDNYAKAILDGLKGPRGIMFDDTQVQSLAISWLDGYGDPAFTVAARASPDDFLLKPIEFYEMQDGLWYPHGRFVWSNGGEQPLTDKSHFVGLSIIELMSAVRKRARAEMRNAGVDRLRAFQQGHYVSSLARGFHRSRISDSGFPLRPRRGWQEERKIWKEHNPGDVEWIDETLAKLRSSYHTMIELLAGRLPSDEEKNP
jgi:hypothetical protein